MTEVMGGKATLSLQVAANIFSPLTFYGDELCYPGGKKEAETKQKESSSKVETALSWQHESEGRRKWEDGRLCGTE